MEQQEENTNRNKTILQKQHLTRQNTDYYKNKVTKHNNNNIILQSNKSNKQNCSCCNPKVCYTKILTVYFNLPIEGTALAPRGTTFLTVYAKHMILANAVEYTKSPLLHGGVQYMHMTG